MGKHIGLRYAIILYYPGLCVTPKLWLFLGCGVPRCNGKRADVLYSDSIQMIICVFQYSTTSDHFFTNCMFIFYKTEVQTVILRCLTGLNLEFWKHDSCFPSDVSKLTLVWNKLNLSLKYWCIEARLVFCNYYRGNIGENKKCHAWKCIIWGVFHRSMFWHLRRKPAVIFSKWLFFQNSLVISWST